jgi:hypothetical protein
MPESQPMIGPTISHYRIAERLRARSFAAVVCLGVVMAAGPGCEAQDLPSGKEQRAPAGWTAHRDPVGFSVNIPKGWSVHTDSSGRVEIGSSSNFSGSVEQVVVWPVLLPADFRSSVAPGFLGKLSRKLRSEIEWDQPRAVSQAVARQEGRNGNIRAVSVLTWVASPKGTAGYVYICSAPAANYSANADTFGNILESFRVTGAVAKPATSQPSQQYERWQDPREGAFSLEVPVRWRVSGGMYRLATLDVRGVVQAVSPDGQSRITIGDPEIPLFDVPTPTLTMLYPEGSWYSPGQGLKYLVRRYIPGSMFVEEYVHKKYNQSCPAMEVNERRERPDAVREMNALLTQYQQMQVGMRLTAGDIAFTCHGSVPMQGYYFAATELVKAGLVVSWSVPYLYGYIAKTDSAADAQAALEHMTNTAQANPDWVRMQQGTVAKTSEIVTRTSQQISHIVSSSYWSRQGTLDEMNRRRSNANLGIEDVIDAQSRQQIKVGSGSNYYWIDNRGAIAGTQTSTQPNINFRELTRLP